YGPIGRRVTEALQRAGVRCTVIELNPATVRQESRAGQAILFGDVANQEVLHSAGIDQADALILTMPDEEAAARACAVARSRAPEIFIVARAHGLSREPALREMGADVVTVDEAAAAQSMLSAVLKRFAV
ncbi:MAG: NAD(P)-binding protein, partial [Planctomycetota bacterium]